MGVFLSMQLILPMGLVYRIVESQSITFVINIKIIHMEGLLFQVLKVIEKFEEFSLCRENPIIEC